MPDAPSMVAGFNHTVKHGGKAFHVQTEDSGASNPRIVTHLFLGGNVLATQRTDYGELVGAAALTPLVRELMEQQHKEVLRNLVAGVYDEPAKDAPSWQPGELELGSASTAAPAIVLRPAPRAAPFPAEDGGPAARAVLPASSRAGQVEDGPAAGAGREPAPGVEQGLDELILSYLAEDRDQS